MAELTIAVSEQLVKPVIEAKIQAAIVEQLNLDNLAPKLVAEMLRAKVNSEGALARSDYDAKHTLIEWLALDAIRRACDAAVREWVEQQKPALLEEVQRQLAQKKNGLAQALVNGLAESVADKYRLSVACHFGDK